MKIVALICVLLGATLVFLSEGRDLVWGYVRVFGFVMLMFGLYQSTRLWVKDNPKDQDDNKDQNGELN